MTTKEQLLEALNAIADAASSAAVACEEGTENDADYWERETKNLINRALDAATGLNQLTVFVVVAVIHHENTWPVTGFSDEAKAKEFAASCNAHISKMPPRPSWQETSPASEKFEAWKRSHPCPENTEADEFEVRRIPFVPPNAGVQQRDGSAADGTSAATTG